MPGLRLLVRLQGCCLAIWWKKDGTMDPNPYQSPVEGMHATDDDVAAQEPTPWLATGVVLAIGLATLAAAITVCWLSDHVTN